VPSPYRITTLKVCQYSSSWTVNPGIEKPGRLKITPTRKKKTHTHARTHAHAHAHYKNINWLDCR
jgi:hypothetical protein